MAAYKFSNYKFYIMNFLPSLTCSNIAVTQPAMARDIEGYMYPSFCASLSFFPLWCQSVTEDKLRE